MSGGSLVVSLSASEAADASRFGPKAANLARLSHAGLPTPGGWAVDADVYRAQLAALGLERTARAVFSESESAAARRAALDMKLGLMDKAIDGTLVEPLLAAWRKVTGSDGQGVVRSSALLEDRSDSSFAGQFQSFLEIDTEEDFLTAIRACWAALWSTRALRYMALRSFDPAQTAMALLVQPLVNAKVSGGGLSMTAEGDMVVNASWGLGTAIAQGEVAPDRYVLDRSGRVKETAYGGRFHSMGCSHGKRAFSRVLSGSACLTRDQASAIGLLMQRAESVIGTPVEIEWAMDDAGLQLLQARPLRVATPQVPEEIWLQHPRLTGQPSGVGWSTGQARVVNCECELERVARGDVVVTTVAGPALAQVLGYAAGIVAELGGSTSHLASLARERGVPAVLGVQEATRKIPDGARVAVDGVAGIVRWMRE